MRVVTVPNNHETNFVRCPDDRKILQASHGPLGGGSVPNALLGRIHRGRGREISAIDGICHDHPLHVLRFAALLRLSGVGIGRGSLLQL